MLLLLNAVLWFAALSAGVMAGVYFTFSVFAMRAFAELDDGAGARTMQAVNRVILRSLFLPLFFLSSAASLLLILFGVLGLGPATMLVTGGMVYMVGMFGVTVVANVPLNNRLEAVDADSAAGRAVWAEYQRRWTPWNHVRTVACIVAMAIFIIAIRQGPGLVA